MSRTGTRTSERLLMSVVLGIVLLVVGWWVLNLVMGAIFALVRVALLLALLGVVAWFVLVGPPGKD
jgi:uncharacterized membrane protein YiaA